jgi:preprotein translocase subunit SecD
MIGAVALGIASGLGGCADPEPGLDEARVLDTEPALKVFMASTEATEGCPIARAGLDGKPIYLAREPLVSSAHVREVEWSTGTGGEKVLVLTLDEEGGATMLSNSASHVGGRLAFVTGDKLLSAPFVRSPLSEKLAVMGPESDLIMLFAKLND